jgi:ABC-type spermidine/putrescine transport system permease subunit II
MKQAGAGYGASLANLLFLYGPIAVLILFSFNASRLSATWQGWSLQWYRALWANQALLDAAANSLWVATVSTLLALLLGVGLAIGLEGLPETAASDRTGAAGPAGDSEIRWGVSLLLFFVHTNTAQLHDGHSRPCVVQRAGRDVTGASPELDPRLLRSRRISGAPTDTCNM